VQRGWERFVLQRLDHLDHAGNTRGGLGMPEIRLHRPEPQRAAVGTTLTVGRQQRLGLQRITEHRSGPVTLHDVHLAGRQAGAVQRLPDHTLLRRTVGGGQAVAGTVLVDSACAHDGQHFAAVPPCFR
jgi:hypothetical protein